ncbi:MAG: adenylate kinase family protein [Candidatus Freyarchaeota archaeon]|nr:adenylate kinase family protein [Candidatus Freyrarchaeum guaymaensis]
MDLQVIVLSGTPGTGKTTLAKLLSQATGIKNVGLSKLVEEKSLFSGIDKERGSLIADLNRLIPEVKRLAEEAGGELIVEGHYADVIPREWVRKVIVLRTHPKELERRLREKGWSHRKIMENVQAEIIGVCTYDAVEAYGWALVYEIDTTSKQPHESLKEALEIISEGGERYRVGRIDWLAQLEREGVLDRYF